MTHKRRTISDVVTYEETVEYSHIVFMLSKKYGSIESLEDVLGLTPGTIQRRTNGAIKLPREAYYAMKWLYHYEELK